MNGRSKLTVWKKRFWENSFLDRILVALGALLEPLLENTRPKLPQVYLLRFFGSYEEHQIFNGFLMGALLTGPFFGVSGGAAPPRENHNYNEKSQKMHQKPTKQLKINTTGAGAKRPIYVQLLMVVDGFFMHFL